MPQGTVEWFSDARGFGLIREEGTGRTFYVIFDQIDGAVQNFGKGVRVTFEGGRRGEADVALRVKKVGI